MRNLSQKLPSRNSGSRFDGHIVLFRKNIHARARSGSTMPWMASLKQAGAAALIIAAGLVNAQIVVSFVVTARSVLHANVVQMNFNLAAGNNA